MEVMTVWGLWILCCGALLGTAVLSELSIRGCEDGSVDVVEDSDPVFTCGEYWIQGPQWTVYDYKEQEVYSGSCTSGSCTPWNKRFRLHEVKHKQRNMHTSRLTIKNITRHSARKLVCSKYLPSASCDLRIIAPAVLKDCDVSIKDWQVHATCGVEHMYTSDGKYSCRWRENNTELLSFFQEPLTEYMFNARAYQTGNCSNIHTMPDSPGNYTYSIQSDPGVWTTITTLNIEPPGDPMYTCHDVVQEGSSVSCKCTSSNPGNPPAEFVWDNLNTDMLHVRNVQLEKNGNQHTCFMTWGPYMSRRQAVLTLKVVDNPLNEGIIPGSVAAVLVLVVIVAVIVVIIKRRKEQKSDNELETQRPAENVAAPSEDMYAIAGPANEGEDKHSIEAADNISYAPKSSSGHQAKDNDHTTNKAMKLKTMALKLEPTRCDQQNREDLAATGYANVTAVPTDSGLGVYYEVSWAAMSKTPGSDARVFDTSNLQEDEYNVLQFQETRTGQEDHSSTYNHLDCK